MTVGRLGFGTLPLSPLQSTVPAAEGAELLLYAWKRGIDFWDTAQIYDNYPVLAAAIKRLPQPPVIATKTYAYTAKQAQEAVEQARRALDLDTIDIMLLHEQSAATLPGHREALNWLVDARDRGVIKAVGISTHRIDGVRAALAEPEIDVIHPLYNQEGLGIHDGTARDMAESLERAASAGKGIYAMKVLGGGALYRNAFDALSHVFAQPWLHSIMIGMSSPAEVDFNLAILAGLKPDEALSSRVKARERRLLVANWCQACGNCLDSCPQGALFLEQGRLLVNLQECVLCGYCSRACPELCLKLV